MASSSSSHQNAAKKIKALLRRTHFPVARLRQLPVTPGLAPGGGGGSNPWDGIVSGDPRAALVVLHWTLLDMSPLFASLLLDRDYAGLNSMTDFKFVATSLRMLRDEFNCRPLLTAEQFLTAGFAEVKMRLLADIVELVMRTHHSIADQQKQVESGVSSSSSSSSSSSANPSMISSSAGSCWGAKSDPGGGGSSRTSSPWNTPTPPPQQQQQQEQRQHHQGQQQQQHSRPGSGEGRYSASGFSAASTPIPTQPRSPPPHLFGGPVGVMNGNRGGVSVIRHHHPLALSPSSTMSDEQNAPPPPLVGAGIGGGGGGGGFVTGVGGGSIGGMPSSSHSRGGGVSLRVPVSVRAAAPLRHDWHIGNGDNTRAFCNVGSSGYDEGGSDGYRGGGVVGRGGGGPSVWVQGRGRGDCSGSNRSCQSGDLSSPRGGLSGAPRPTGGRSPLGPRSAQRPLLDLHHQQHHVPAMDLGDPAPMAMLPPPVLGPTAGEAGGELGNGAGGGVGSDWLAVQQAFGSPSGPLRMPAVVVPTSPSDAHAGRARAVSGSPIPQLPPRSASASSVVVPASPPDAHLPAAGVSGSPMPKLIARSPSASVAASPADAAAADRDGENGIKAADRDGENGMKDNSSSSRMIVPVGSGHDERRCPDQQMPNGGGGWGDSGGGGQGPQQQRGHSDDEDDGSLTEELRKMQHQIEAMLERHSRTLEGRMGETEKIISARLALLETKVLGLEIGSPLHT